MGRTSMSARRVRKISNEQLQGVARFWVRQVLLNDDRGRQQGSTTMSSTSSVNIFAAHAPS